MLDFIALGVSAIYIAVVTVLVKTGKLNLRYKKRSPAFWGVVGLGAFVGVAGVWAAIDFNSAFNFFHRILFTNDLWLLNPETDLLIRICPSSMFESMGLRIALRAAVILLGVPVLLTVLKWISNRVRKRKTNETVEL